jgi:nucleotide-binding universal stress UspA family protein
MIPLDRNILSLSEAGRAAIKAVDEAIARAERAEADAKAWQNQCYVETECGDGRVDAAIAERDALGIQLVAMRARLQLAEAVIETSRKATANYFGNGPLAGVMSRLHDALVAFDAVPGDERRMP